MARSGSNSGTIQSLLQDRQQLEEWIERLDLASEEVPEAVRQKVRGDYESRLSNVLEELAQYTDDLSEALKAEVEGREGLWAEEREARERLAEAKLRHMVGEHTDKEWLELQAEVEETLGRVIAELENATAEISRLEDVLAAMAPTRHRAATDSSATPADEADDGGDEVDEGEVDSEAEKQQTDAFEEDDLTFIKSTRSTAASDEAQRKGDEDEQTEPVEVDPVIEERVPRPSSITVGESFPTAKKTLKCGECGKLNYPTEWYCEHCGAELASL